MTAPFPSSRRLVLAASRLSRPSYRFRLGQFLSDWSNQGFHCQPLQLSRHAPRRFLQLGWSRGATVIVQQRLIHQWELRWLRRLTDRLIYDVDDSVMVNVHGQQDRRRERRFAAMVHAADLVVCGSPFLLDEVTSIGGTGVLIPTVVDTDRFAPCSSATAPRSAEQPIVIGWTGSRPSNGYLNLVAPALRGFGRRVVLRVLSDTMEGIDQAAFGSVPIEFIRWNPENEVPVAQSFDLGIMPLEDNPFTRGKCGCKALQYMSLGLPAVVSPVGMNRDLIAHGQNGFCASSLSDWRDAIGALIEQPELRSALGAAGRQTVVERYSVKSQLQMWRAALGGALPECQQQLPNSSVTEGISHEQPNAKSGQARGVLPGPERSAA